MDAGLVSRAMFGDAAAFERLAATSIHRLHRLAYSILGSARGADDATQAAGELFAIRPSGPVQPGRAPLRPRPSGSRTMPASGGSSLPG